MTTRSNTTAAPGTTQVIMPQLGESVVEGKVARWLKQVGDAIEEFEPLLEVSTDKVDSEIPAPASGTLLQILVPEGETVERGTVLAVIGTEAAAIAPPAAPAGKPAPPSVASVANGSNGNGASSAMRNTRVTPVVARMAAEHGLDLSKINGTGSSGRVTKQDVEAYLAGNSSESDHGKEPPPWEQPVSGDLFKPTSEIFAKASQSVGGAPAIQPPAAPPLTPKPTAIQPVTQQASKPAELAPGDELVPLSSMRRLIADHMVQSKLHISPHVTTVFEIDLSAVNGHQAANFDAFAKQGLKLTLTAYFVMAAARALQLNPTINSQWSEQGMIVHRAAHIGMAVALPDGLIVPVIRNAQDLNLTGAARAVNDMAKRAREKQLKPDEISGGTFTITNHGVSGSLFATPIINQPQAAILGTGAMQKRAVVISDPRGDSLAIRPMMYATLTFDHRLIDGATGDGFMRTFKETLENWS